MVSEEQLERKLSGSCLCGNLKWEFSGRFESGQEGGATACNCNACRRYGALWAYGYFDEDISASGTVTCFIRSDLPSEHLGFHFCPTCGNLGYWKSLRPGKDGHYRGAVNLRLCTEPKSIMNLPIDHFDGLNAFKDLPRDGRRVIVRWS